MKKKKKRKQKIKRKRKPKRMVMRKKRKEELRAFEQEWRKEIEDQAEIDKIVEEMAKMEIKQREIEGDEEGHEQLSDHLLKFKIWQVEGEWKAEK